MENFLRVVHNLEKDTKEKEQLLSAMREFGFEESERMIMLRAQIHESPDRLAECYMAYEEETMAEIVKREEQEGAKENLLETCRMIGRSIAKALLYMEAGRKEDGYTELFEDLEYMTTESFLTPAQLEALHQLEQNT